MVELLSLPRGCAFFTPHQNLKSEESIGSVVDVIDPKELSAKMLKKNKINLDEISHDYAIGLVHRVLNIGVLLTEVSYSPAEVAKVKVVQFGILSPDEIEYVVAEANVCGAYQAHREYGKGKPKPGGLIRGWGQSIER